MHPSQDCSSCNPSYSKTSWSAQADGSTCKADNYSCTRDICKSGKCTHPLKAGNCFIGGKCYANGTKNPQNSCQYCNTKLSVGSWNVLTNGTSCKADAFSCTQDVCNGGVCSHPIKPGYCKIGNTCYAAGTQKPGIACLSCNPGQSAYGWASRPNGSSCPSDGKFCTSDSCQGGSCSHTPVGGYCYINGSCYYSGQHMASTSCYYCNPSKSLSGWSSYSYFGCCAGNTVKYCENGIFKQLNCSLNPSCGWSSTYQYYDCGTYGGSHSSYPKNC